MTDVSVMVFQQAGRGPFARPFPKAPSPSFALMATGLHIANWWARMIVTQKLNHGANRVSLTTPRTLKPRLPKRA